MAISNYILGTENINGIILLLENRIHLALKNGIHKLLNCSNSLEEVDTNGELNSMELSHLVKRCPNLNKSRFKYHRNSSNEDEDHLAKLCVLDHLTQLSISCANFFEHHLFQVLEVRGDQIIHLELVDVDEINLNGILMLGANCTNLKKLCLHGCHFQMQPEDVGTVDALCQSKIHESGKS